MSKPKFGPTSSKQQGKTAEMKSRMVGDKVFGRQIVATIESIEADRERGKLGSDKRTHEFHYVPDGVDLSKPISGDALGELVAVRLRHQGYRFEFDPVFAKDAMDKGARRMQRLLGN